MRGPTVFRRFSDWEGEKQLTEKFSVSCCFSFSVYSQFSPFIPPRVRGQRLRKFRDFLLTIFLKNNENHPEGGKIKKLRKLCAFTWYQTFFKQVFLYCWLNFRNFSPIRFAFFFAWVFHRLVFLFSVVFKNHLCLDCGLTGDVRLMSNFCHMEPVYVHPGSLVQYHPKKPGNNCTFLFSEDSVLPRI